jgi:thiol-disulfide isomerase/thioredoxin
MLAGPRAACVVLIHGSVMSHRLVSAALFVAFMGAAEFRPAFAQSGPDAAVPSEAPPAVGGPAWLGVMLAAETGPGGGVIVRRTIPGSPAAASTLQRGAELLSINGRVPVNPVDFTTMVSEIGAGGQATLVIAGVADPLVLTLAARPPGPINLTRMMIDTPAVDVPITDVHTSTAQGLLAPGRVHIVEFWATWCGPCHAALPQLREIRGRYTDTDLRMVAVTTEDEATVRAFMARETLPWPVVADTAEAVAAEYWVEAYPTWVVIDRGGVIRGVYTGLDEWATLQRMVATLVAEPLPPEEGSQQ